MKYGHTCTRTVSAALAMLCVPLCLGLLPRRAAAWGQEGHRIVARAAWQRLTPKARREVRKLLRPGETLESVSTWADTVRNFRPETSRWHYVDIPKDEPGYDAARHCQRTPLGDCVVLAVDGGRRTLRGAAAGLAADEAAFWLALMSARASQQARYEALKFLVHFVGDLHQPLHCADNHDRGGNDVAVTFFGQKSNLHRVWDSDIIKRAGLNQTARRVAAAISTEDAAALAADPVVTWVDEAHTLARTNAYDVPADNRLGQDYYQKNRPVVETQLARAGARLAGILNEVFK
jgi:hypothetical protein